MIDRSFQNVFAHLAAPSISVTQPPVLAVGEDLMLTCTTSGGGSLTTTWSPSNRAIINGDPHGRILKISGVQESDSNNYTCELAVLETKKILTATVKVDVLGEFCFAKNDCITISFASVW